MFQCTPTLNGRLFPSPSSQGRDGIYVLDFFDNRGRHVHHTGLNIYDRGIVGGEKRRVLNRPASFYHLSSDRVVEIADGNDERLKVISFWSLDRSIAVR